MLLIGATYGCAGMEPYKTPCEFTVKVRLEADTNKTHETCRKVLHSCPDEGCEFKGSGIVAGCADTAKNKMVIVNQDFVIAHEMRHFFDAKCR